MPVDLSVENLRGLRGKDLSIVVLPDGWHGLTLTPDGLEPEAARSTGFCPGLFTYLELDLRERPEAAAMPSGTTANTWRISRRPSRMRR